MSGGFQDFGGLCNCQDIGSNFAAFQQNGIQVDPSATANTKGSWVQLVSSLGADCSYLNVQAIATSPSPATNAAAFDIGVGGAGSEKVIISNFVAGHGSSFSATHSNVSAPLHIPAGSRIAARCQTNLASETGILYLKLMAWDSALYTGEGFAGLDDMGFNSATTAGTTITPGNGAKGSWTQITASTAKDYFGLIAEFDQGGSITGKNVVDIGIGGAGSEVVLVPNFELNLANQVPVSPLFPVSVPSGSRLSVRASNSDNATTAFNVTLHGLY